MASPTRWPSRASGQKLLGGSSPAWYVMVAARLASSRTRDFTFFNAFFSTVSVVFAGATLMLPSPFDIAG
uniref:Uncharacterized protein n=1 Tax=Arundo donax TaxID=35708 RepID=A0A0A9BXV5_ARUDO